MATNQTALHLKSSALAAENRALKSEVRRLQKRNARLQVEVLSLRERTAALEKLKTPKVKQMDENEVARRTAFVLNQGGYEFVDGKAVKVRESVSERKKGAK